MRGDEALRLLVTDAERAAGALSESTLAEAKRIFAEHGCVILEALFERSLIERLHHTFEAQHGAMSHDDLRALCKDGRSGPYLKVGDSRYEIAPRMVGAFGDPAIFASPLILPLLYAWLGTECQLNSFTLVVSYPGAQMQHIHRDHAYLFLGYPDEVSTGLPPYAVNIGIPLVDVDLETGPTAVFPGSHRWPLAREPDVAAIVPPALVRGDCMITDYRTIHAGMPNRSTRVRPNLYVSYSRPWFFDEVNHQTRNPTDIPTGAYGAIPALRMLLRRASARREHGPAPAASQSPSPAVQRPRAAADVARECPCGSGRPLAECHGR